MFEEPKQVDYHRWLYICTAAIDGINIQLEIEKKKEEPNAGMIAYYEELLYEYKLSEHEVLQELQYD